MYICGISGVLLYRSATSQTQHVVAVVLVGGMVACGATAMILMIYRRMHAPLARESVFSRRRRR